MTDEAIKDIRHLRWLRSNVRAPTDE